MTPLLERSEAFRRLPRGGTKRRRPRPWLRLLQRLLRVGLVVLSAGGLAGWTLTSPVFGLSEIRVEGASRVAPGWVVEQLAPWRQRNLFTLDLGSAQRRLVQHRWVQAVELEKVLPDQLVVRLIEYRPVALLTSVEGTWFVAEDGRAIATADSELSSWLLLRSDRASDDRHLAPGDRQRAIALARSLETTLPEWHDRLTEIELLGELDLGLRFGAVPYRVLVHADTAMQRIDELTRLLPYLAGEVGVLDEVDLRFAGRMILRSLSADSRSSSAESAFVPAALVAGLGSRIDDHA